jgi:cell division protein FtsW
MTSAVSAPILARSDTSWLTEWRRTVDWGLIAASFFLLAIGLLLSLAAGPSAGARIGYDDPMFFTYRHTAFAGLASIILIGVSLLDKVWARRFAAVVFLGAFVLMAYILLFGHEAKGAQRWIRVGGFSLQPSEMVKPALIVLTGWLLAQRELFPRGPWAVLAFVFFAVTLGLLLLQPDVGQSALLMAAFVATFFVSGLPWKWAAAFGVGGAGLGAVLYTTLAHVRYRVNGFFDPSMDSFQTDMAAKAIGRGGIFGVGPGEGVVKASLPDAHTDFIFSVMVEEFGFIAAIVLIGIFAYITLRGLRAASRIPDPYPRAAAAGLFTLFGLQAVINMAVNVALIPPKGMTLPFVSYGGSSMMGTALTLGLALALIRGHSARTRTGYG